MTRGLKLFPRTATHSTHRKQSPKLSDCGYSSILSQEWGRTVLSPGRLVCFQQALLDGWDLAFPIRALAQSAGPAVALPCSVAQAPAGSSRVRTLLPVSGAKTTRAFMLVFCTHSPPHREVHTGISVQHHMERMWKDGWFLRLVRSCHQKARFQNGRSEQQHLSHSKHSAPARQGDACLQSQQVFEMACSGKGIGFYFACDALFWYSQSRFNNAHQK